MACAHFTSFQSISPHIASSPPFFLSLSPDSPALTIAPRSCPHTPGGIAGETNDSTATTIRFGPGDIIGTHNGTIYNADYLFRRFKLRRFAQVDSELLFRLAHNAVRDDRIDMEMFRARLELCRGQITAVLASRLDPETILVLKGNKPLELRIHRRYRAALYASDPAFLDAVLADERGWRELSLEFTCLPKPRRRQVAQAKRGKAP